MFWKINCYLSVPFINWFLYVLKSITFVLRNTRATTGKEFVYLLISNWNLCQSGGLLFMLNFALFSQTERPVRFGYKLFLLADRTLVFYLGYVKVFVSKQDRVFNVILIGCNIYLRNTREWIWIIGIYKIEQTNFLECILLASDWFKNNWLLSQLTHAHYRDTVPLSYAKKRKGLQSIQEDYF